jgi:hypothetical protein
VINDNDWWALQEVGLSTTQQEVILEKYLHTFTELIPTPTRNKK